MNLIAAFKNLIAANSTGYPGLANKSIDELKKFIVKNKFKNIFSLFSGGKDSLVATHLMWRIAQTLKINFEVIHVNTTCALPGVEKYIKKVSKNLDWPIRILKPKVDFWTLAEKWGAPSPRRRWCCFHLKLEPVREYTKKYEPPRLHLLGLRAFESPSRLKKTESGQFKQYYWDSKSEAWTYNPIFWWKDQDVDEYIERNDLPINPAYEKVGMGGECFCGVFKTLRELQSVKAEYPNFFQKLVDLESKFKNNGSLLYISGKKIYIKDL